MLQSIGLQRVRHDSATEQPPPQKTLSSQNNLEKEEQAEAITRPDFKLYYNVIAIKTVY